MPRSESSGGRPRRSGVITDNPREGVVAAAAALFARHGYAGTTMSAIAAASGLTQSSIYYWFRSKEEILSEIVDQNRISLTAARALVDRSQPAAVRLTIVIHQDLVQMCRAPLDFYTLEDAAGTQPHAFSGFGEEYAELTSLIERIVQQGIDSGSLGGGSASSITRTLLDLNEGAQHRFRTRARGVGELQELADHTVGFALRALLADPGSFADVRAAARDGIAGFGTVVPV